ncbi:MAG: PHP domain-containing protein [Nitrospirota bacterium]
MPVEFRADLHIHTCLSPCADLLMSPYRIVEKAASLGLNIIAICDHNSAENVEVTKKLAKERGINAIPGMEVTSSEEVHILGLFNDMDSILMLQKIVYDNLQPGENNEEVFGYQVIMNENDEVLGFNKRLLIGSTTLSVDKILEIIHSLGGLAIAAHIDREGFGIIGQLGFIPPNLNFDALEISSNITFGEARYKFMEYSHIPWITSSDAHNLSDIGKVSTGFYMNHSTFDELHLALQKIEGRNVILD